MNAKGNKAYKKKIRRSLEWIRFNPNKIIGLRNTGSNCHANSVMQCLVRCQPIRLWIITCQPRKCHRQSSREFCCFCALRAVMRRFATAEKSFYGTRVLIKGLAGSTSVDFVGQSDANEFALLLLQKAYEHYQTNHIVRFNIRNSIYQSFSNKNIWFEKILDFTDLFTLRFKRIWTCQNCKETKSTVESYPIVYLTTIRKLVLTQQLQRIIHHRDEPRKKCTKCERYLKHETTITNRPPVLIFAICRVDQRLRKNKRKCIYEPEISLEFTKKLRSLSPHLSDNSTSLQRKIVCNSLKRTYKLCSIITHSGCQSFGHYSAIVRSGGSKWNVISDETHYKIPLTEVCGRKDVTLLFYVTDFSKARALNALEECGQFGVISISLVITS
ncbi:hypothetical protein GJ496_003016 [Pomphorhynchus laevis]|nr:hypothetical protein GJ496_003016 [Pomphorhynchus laevis]